MVYYNNSKVVGNSVLEPGSGSVLKLRDEMVER